MKPRFSVSTCTFLDIYLQNRINVPVDFEVVQCMIDMLNALL